MATTPHGKLAFRLHTKVTRSGFTLIELLVVVFILCILGALIVPAVQSAREAARRATCANNLKQMGLSLQNYAQTCGVYPPVHILSDRLSSTDYLSPQLRLLPYLEQGALYSSINISIAWREYLDAPSLENRTYRNTVIFTFLCPSDAQVNRMNNYRLNGGRFNVGNAGRVYDGPFNIGTTPSPVSITDGLSHTVVMSERIAGSFSAGRASDMRDLKSSKAVSPIVSDAQYIPVCVGDPGGIWNPWAGRYWFYAGFANTLYNHNGSPNDLRPTCYTGGATDSGAGGLSPPRSNHPGGVNALYGDSHVTNVINSIDTRVWIALGTHDSGDLD